MSNDGQHIYRRVASATHTTRRQFAASSEDARKYYARYTAFVISHLTRHPSRILDIGCGEGWSTLIFGEADHQAYGLDLHSGPLEARALDRHVRYMTGDAQRIPAPDAAFDVVAMHQVLAHVPNPETALRECVRVLRTKGRLIIVGPNLMSFLDNGYWAVRHTLRCLSRGRIWERRTPGMARHPGGNTMPETWTFTALFLFRTLRKLLGERPPTFWMREPDTTSSRCNGGATTASLGAPRGSCGAGRGSFSRRRTNSVDRVAVVVDTG